MVLYDTLNCSFSLCPSSDHNSIKLQRFGSWDHLLSSGKKKVKDKGKENPSHMCPGQLSLLYCECRG
jgi:hypothetical protein